MANLPLGFAELAAGAVLLVAGLQNKTPAQVLLGEPSTTPPLSSGGVSSPTAAGTPTGASSAIPDTTSTLGQGNSADAAQAALDYLGVPYEWGGLSKLGVDCSGLVVKAYQAVGITLPHNAAQQWAQIKATGTVTTLADAEANAGRLIFLEPSSTGPNHVAISTGNGFAVEAPHTGTDVKTIKISDLVGYDGLVGVGLPAGAN